MKKRILPMLMALVMMLGMIVTAEASSNEALDAAQKLYEQGLFSGTGTNSEGKPNFSLDRAPTRNEAVTMLVRLLGKADEAVNGTWNIPFTDVADWAKPYVGYAYTNGLTAGTSATTYGGDQTITATQYITFVLRSLGYQAGTDFQWNKAWELSDKIGLTDGRYNADTTNFTRGDVAIISYKALLCEKAPEASVINNIPASELEELIKYYVALKENTDSLVTLSGSVMDNGTITDEIRGNIALACLFARATVVGWEKIYDTCGNYDDTQTLKKYAAQMKNAYQYLPTDMDFFTAAFNDNLNYLIEYLKILDVNQGIFNMFRDELLPIARNANIPGF